MRRVSCASTRRSSMSRVSPSARSIAGLRDLVEDHPPHRHLRLQHLREVPGDRLALAVFVRREQELVGVLQLRLQVGDDLLLARVDDIERLEVVVDVDAEAGPRLALVLRRDLGRVVGQVADVADRRLDDVVGAEVAGDRLRLGRRLDDHELLPLGCGHFARHHSAGDRPMERDTRRADDERRHGPRPTPLYSRSPPFPGRSCASPSVIGPKERRTCPVRAATCWPPATCRISTRGRSGSPSGRGASCASWRSRSSSGSRSAR